MSASEVDLVSRRFQARLDAILSPSERATYTAYQDRIRAALARHDPALVGTTPAEQAILDKIAGDTEAAALNKQFLALLRVEHLPQ